ncbi:MAG: hypothetical protein HY482_00395 [Candidatus Wildermuthbacteria bacterium]|nr:hypothetical protein [Candidatus Wildermuthbacteria bacterium]
MAEIMKYRGWAGYDKQGFVWVGPNPEETPGFRLTPVIVCTTGNYPCVQNSRPGAVLVHDSGESGPGDGIPWDWIEYNPEQEEWLNTPPLPLPEATPVFHDLESCGTDCPCQGRQLGWDNPCGVPVEEVELYQLAL